MIPYSNGETAYLDAITSIFVIASRAVIADVCYLHRLNAAQPAGSTQPGSSDRKVHLLK